MRKTKLVITMGPALQDEGRLREILRLADAVRLNASHGDAAVLTRNLGLARGVAAELGRRIPVFLDLQGPKWRVGALEEPLELADGSRGVFYPSGEKAPAGFDWAVPLPHPELFRGAREGQEWLLDDGNLVVQVVEAAPALIGVRVKVGGQLKARKGVHPVGLDVILDPLTPKDLEDIRWGVEAGVDLFAQSFVRRGEDVEALAVRIRACGGDQPIIGKIEHPMALENLDAILERCWGVMVARGDLGVELGVERVPALQKQIIRQAQRALKPVITATQMLESMILNAQPTRAEASDVANAIWDGTDAVMLSAESAAGEHPVEAVQWLARIAEEADQHMKPATGEAERVTGRTDVAVAHAACLTAVELGAKALVVFSEGGGSARMVSRLAPGIPIVGLTTDPHNALRMGLLRGVRSLVIPRAAHMSEMVAAVQPLLKAECAFQAGDRVVLTLGHPLWQEGNTNTMRVLTY